MVREQQSKKGIDFLLEKACPSIRYRTQVEILGHSPNTREMVQLQRRILQDRLVSEVTSWQQRDGWLAHDFHGERSMETGIRILCEKGMRKDNPFLARALRALEKHEDRLGRGIGKVGRILDERNHGGSQMIRAAVFAYAAQEKKTFLKEQIIKAFMAFEAVTQIKNLEEVAQFHKCKFIFKPHAQWPSIYHLRLLAFTRDWRTRSNMNVIEHAIRKLVGFSPIPDIYVLHRSQIVAPASFAMNNFVPHMDSMDSVAWMMFFCRMELLARLGVIGKIPELRRQVKVLCGILDEGGGMFTKRLTPYYFKKWGAYSGLMLEKDWRSPVRRICDLTFRSLLIVHYSGVSHSYHSKRYNP